MKRFSVEILLVMLAAILIVGGVLVPGAARAQGPGDIDVGEIFEDIFSGGPMDQYSLTRKLPVTAEFDAWPEALPEDAFLVVTAEARPRPNERRAYPLVLGETRVLLPNVSSGPINLDITLPSKALHDERDPVIRAAIRNHAGDTLYDQVGSPREDGRRMVIRLQSVHASRPADPDVPPSPEPWDPYNEVVRGDVVTDSGFRLPEGSVLVARIIEEGLAGGPTGPSVAAESRNSLDYNFETPSFELNLPRQTTRALASPALEVWIEDRYGARLYQMRRPLPWDGDTNVGALELEAVQPDPLPAPDASLREIRGEAQFDAHKGMPRGARMITRLEDVSRADAAAVVLAEQTRVLDGLSGYVDFELDVPEWKIKQLPRRPVLRVRIETKDGDLLFTNDYAHVLERGRNDVRLKATSRY